MREEEINALKESNAPPVTGPIMEIEHLQKSFDNHTVLKDINLKVNNAENVVILGRSGSGKSVLIKCIVGLIFPEKGNIRILGKDITNMTEEGLNEIRTNIGFLFQSAALYDSMTVRENLEFPIKRNKKISENLTVNVKDLVEEALEDVGLKDAINKMPSELSGGMRKRIGLARTFILKPTIMLYDEPTTGMDPITSHEISELIIKMQKKYHTTSIIITHDMPCARTTSDRIVILKDGSFAAEGTYDQLSNSNDEWVRGFFKN